VRIADWLVFVATLGYVAWYGLWRARGTADVRTFVLAGRHVPWYAVGLSIMATQASAVTFISTTGQAYVDGMRFVQFYFGLPIAMAILSYTAVPLFRGANVYTAYEYLERRFDARVRAMISGIFLLQRGLAVGVTLYAPAVVLTVILGWPDWLTTVIMGGLAISYTTSGGAKAIAWSDFQQMVVMTLGLTAAAVSAVLLLPDHVSLTGAWHLAAAAGRLNVVTTTFDWNDRYNLWSGPIGGAFLALAYFGTDQSQVQRYLSAESVRDARRGLLFNAVAKVPMQLCILFIGVLVFVFYVFTPPPVVFQRLDQARLEAADLGPRYAALKQRYDAAFSAREQAADRLLAPPDGESSAMQREPAAEAFREANRALEQVRRDAAGLARSSGGTGASDTNYIFLTFVTQHLPAGLVGLVLAVIFGATMTSLSAEMSALATVTVVDIYQRHVRTDATDHQYLTASRVATVFWGVYAIVCAQFIKGMGSLVEAVNVLGSLFYGGMLGVFVLAFFFPRVTARGALCGVLVGQIVIFACWKYTGLAFLWYNVLGCVVVVLTGLALSALDHRERAVLRSTPGASELSGSEGPIA
jgi:Na+/proline symporter